MNKNSKTAIVLGATGLTGSMLLKLLAEDPRFENVKVFSRRPLEFEHPKIKVTVCDLFELESVKSKFTGDIVYCCIGTTRKKTPDKNQYRKIDFGIPVAAAALAETNNIPCFIVISTMGAHINSSFFYSRTKAEMEQDVSTKKIDRIHILRPSLILGKRNENRVGEGFAQKLDRIFGFLLGKFRGITALDIAKCMQNLPFIHSAQLIIPSFKIKELANLDTTL